MQSANSDLSIAENLFRVALIQPDIAENVGAVIRICACFGANLDIIEPCGFVFDERKIKRVAMDYINIAGVRRHLSLNDYKAFSTTNFSASGGRKILLTTKAEINIYDFRFAKNDILMFGSESSGAPTEAHEMADYRVRIPISGNARSLNLAMSAAIAVSEATRQLRY
jgi:tRNA (cytidine/uridine-2'-O-)-methyltransferase